MGKIEGERPMTPELRETYKQEFAHGLDLFQRGLVEYEKADEFHKKALLKDVMDKALDVMNETAKVVLTREAQNRATQLDKDYQNYIHHENPQNYNRLNDDIQNLKEGL